MVEAGEVEVGLARLRQGFAARRAKGAGNSWNPYRLDLQAEAHDRVGQISEALVLLRAVLEGVKEAGGAWFEAELHRLRGEALLRTEQPEMREAEACFHRALAVAQKQSARWWELRAARSLARLWAHQGPQGQRQRAYDLLAPVYGWFTEGFDLPDLKDAKALLDALA
jgi:predicted ATPase